MQPPFVKKFDFRGIYNHDIKDQDAFYLALAIEKTLPLKKILIGWDTRKSSENLAMNFMQALKETAIEIHFIEKCPIDYVTCAAQAFDFDFSVMFTGSHNPWDWTGLLMHTKGGDSVQGELVTKIIENYYDSLGATYTKPTIDLLDYEDFQPTIEDAYIKKIAKLFSFEKIKQMNVLVDLGDGSGSQSLTLLSHYLPQVSFFRLNDRNVYDAKSSHIADPSNKENMLQLQTEIKKNKYDCGFAFDSDSDRVLAVDENGEYLNGSLIGSALIDAFDSIDTIMNTFGYAVDCGPAVKNTVSKINSDKKKNFEVLPVPVGRSILRRMIRDGKVDMAIENVGHFYIKDFFYTDSGVFSLFVVLYWISQNGALSKLQIKHNDGLRDQFTIPVTLDQKKKRDEFAKKVDTIFAKYAKKTIMLDGIRCEYYQDKELVAWFAIRQSGYEKIDKYYFGAINSKDFESLKNIHRKDI